MCVAVRSTCCVLVAQPCSSRNGVATTQDGQGGLHYSCRKGFLDITGLLVTAGANVNAPDLVRPPSCGGCLVVAAAIVFGLTTQVANSRKQHGATPLLVATNNGVVASVQQLLNLGASPNIATDVSWVVGRTRQACWKPGLCFADVAKSCNSRPQAGITPLMAAVAQRKRALVEVLLEKGADVNAATKVCGVAACFLVAPALRG